MSDVSFLRDAGRSFLGDPGHLALTKTLAPAAGKFAVVRSRLLRLLDKAAERKLTLIKAPAGYGKTTLAAEWSDRLSKSGALVAWLSLDTDDNEPGAFASYLAKAVENTPEGLGHEAIQLLHGASLVPPRNIVSSLVNSVCESDSDIFLILDDFHLITDPRCLDLVVHLLRYSPSNLHTVILSRVEPRLGVSRLRLEDQLVEIEAADLHFDMEETREFLGEELSESLKPAGIAKLFAATEGWPAAIQLARIALRKASDPLAHIRALSGTTPRISEYLEDTLSTAPPDLVDFLLKTSILDQINGALCSVVSGRTDGAALLQALEREQFMLVLLDETEGWYRYHHLLREYLVNRLRTHLADQVPDLYRRAYRWHAERNLWSEAVHYAILAGDLEQAVAYIEHCAMALVIKGDLLTLLNWERQLPPEIMDGQLEIKLALAWGMMLVTRFREADALLLHVEQATAPEAGSQLWWRCRSARAVFYALADDSARGREVAAECLEGHKFDPFDFIALCNVERYAHLRAGNWKAFASLPTPEFDVAETSYVLAENYRLCLHGIAATKQLDFEEALKLYDAAKSLAERHVGPRSVAAAMATGLVAQVKYEQGDAADAEFAVLDALDLIETAAFHEGFLQAFLTLSRSAADRGDVQKALTILNRAERLAWERGWPRIVATLLAERVRILIENGSVSEALPLLQAFEPLKTKHPAKSGSSWAEIHTYATISKGLVAGATGHLADAAVLLESAFNALAATSDRVAALRVGSDLAKIKARSVPEAAFLVLRKMLGWAARAKHAGFIDNMDDQLTRLVLAGIEQGAFADDADIRRYVADIVPTGGRAACRASEAMERNRHVLTAREQSILAFIAEGQSNKEIARELGVAPETVKTHVKRIFQKLSAETRAQAVVRAQYLGILGRGNGSGLAHHASP